MAIWDVDREWTIRLGATVEADTLAEAQAIVDEMAKPDLPEHAGEWAIDMDSDPQEAVITRDDSIVEWTDEDADDESE